MRVIMLALVLANVLFFMWSTWVAEPPVEALPRQVEGTAELRLMSELDNPPAVPAVAAAASADGQLGPDALALTEQLPAADEASLAPMLEVSADAQDSVPPDAPDDAQQTAAAMTDGSPGINNGAEPGEQLADDAVPSREIDQLVALPVPEQDPAAALEVEVPPEVPTTIQVAVGALETRCASLGPYLNLREATEAASRLRAAGLAPRQRLSEEQVWVGHWVYLPSFADRDEAVAVVERLRAAGVKDIYIEPRGDRENAVSLGLFSDRENAELYAGEVRQYEVRPQITDRYRLGSAYWVDITLRADQPFDLAPYQGGEVRKVRLEEGSCPEPNGGESDPVD